MKLKSNEMIVELNSLTPSTSIGMELDSATQFQFNLTERTWNISMNNIRYKKNQMNK